MMIDHHAESIEELDVQGILAFAERVLPRAADLWVQASLDQKQRLQQLFFPEGIGFDGNRFNRTTATALLFSYLTAGERADERLVSQEGIEPSTRRLRVMWAEAHRLTSNRINSLRATNRLPVLQHEFANRNCARGKSMARRHH